MLGNHAHADEDLLERYAMGRLSDPEAEEFEDHLALCERCQEALEAHFAYIGAMRSAARRIQRESQTRRKRWYGRLTELPKLSWALGMAAVALLVLAGIKSPLPHASAPALVVLEATRGSDGLENASAPAGQPLNLQLDLTGVQPAPRYQVELVDGSGSSLHRTEASPDNGRLRVGLPHGYSAGVYYIRVYTLSRDLLREYSLNLQ